MPTNNEIKFEMISLLVFHISGPDEPMSSPSTFSGADSFLEFSQLFSHLPFVRLPQHYQTDIVTMSTGDS